MSIQNLKKQTRSRFISTLASIVLPLLLTSGCMLTDMQQKTDDLDQKSTDLDNYTKALYGDLRQGNSTDLRRKFLDQMDQDPTEQEKISDATVYCMSMEFQLIKALPLDGPDNQLSLFHEAMEQFMFDLTRYIPDPTAKIDPSSTSTRDEGMFAFSLAIFQVNANEELRRDKAGEQQITVMSLLENALADAKAVDTGKITMDKLEVYKQDVLLSEDAAVHLLQAQVNFVPALLLNSFTNISSQSLLGKFMDLELGTKGSFDAMNIVQMSKLTGYLHESNETAVFLNQNGFSLNVNGQLVKLLSKLELPTPGGGAIEAKYSNTDRVARVTAESALLTELHTYRKQVGAE
jgi:hypothetical protein